MIARQPNPAWYVLDFCKLHPSFLSVIPFSITQELFLRDPLGDIPWSEDDSATDVQHLDYPSFKR